MIEIVLLFVVFVVVVGKLTPLFPLSTTQYFPYQFALFDGHLGWELPVSQRECLSQYLYALCLCDDGGGVTNTIVCNKQKPPPENDANSIPFLIKILFIMGHMILC